MRLLIDADILIYAVANASDGNARKLAKENGTDFIPEPVAHVLHSLKASVTNLIEDYDDYQLYISGAKETNFRYDVYSQYKAKRPPKPHHYQACHDYLLTQWGAVVCHGEADDALGVAGWKAWGEAVKVAEYFGHPDDPWNYLEVTIATIDKDLLMIPAIHHNWRKQTTVNVGELDGWTRFCRQLLTGDSVDNIPGLDRVGDVTANHILDSVTEPTEARLLGAVVQEYARRKVALANLTRNADLLWIQRDQARGSAAIRECMDQSEMTQLWKATADDPSEKPTKPPRKKKP